MRNGMVSHLNSHERGMFYESLFSHTGACVWRGVNVDLASLASRGIGISRILSGQWLPRFCDCGSQQQQFALTSPQSGCHCTTGDSVPWCHWDTRALTHSRNWISGAACRTRTFNGRRDATASYCFTLCGGRYLAEMTDVRRPQNVWSELAVAATV
jgi:hypothetical protein